MAHWTLKLYATRRISPIEFRRILRPRLGRSDSCFRMNNRWRTRRVRAKRIVFNCLNSYPGLSCSYSRSWPFQNRWGGSPNGCLSERRFACGRSCSPDSLHSPHPGIGIAGGPRWPQDAEMLSSKLKMGVGTLRGIFFGPQKRSLMNEITIGNG